MIGILICHCGTNIAGTVDIPALRSHFEGKGHFVLDHLFLCSKAGQEAIDQAIREKGLDRVVIASCSPRHHGSIFKHCVGRALNPFMWDMANIREQCAWTTDDREEATRKAKAIISGSIARVMHHSPVGTMSVPVVRRVAVVGGGIAGMHAALELADKGLDVVLLEKEPVLGGNMARLDRTFPTDDCAMCTISPILNRVASEPRIRVLTMTEVRSLEGRPGDFMITVLKRPRHVDQERCTGCGECAIGDVNLGSTLLIKEGLVDRIRLDLARCTGCGECAKACAHGALSHEVEEEMPSYDTTRCVGCWACLDACDHDALRLINVCPVVAPSEYDLGLGPRKAIYIPTTQGVPLKYLRDPERCLRLNGKMDCLGCGRACSAAAVVEEEESQEQIKVGAVVVATGYRQTDLSGTEYRAEHPDVITGLELERLLSPSGPTQGRLLRPSDSRPPRRVVFVQCAGSRDRRRKEYCSKVCCMYATKNAWLIKSEDPGRDVKVCYTDLRAAGRGYEEYLDRAREAGVEYVRGNVAEVMPLGDRLVVKVEDTLLGEPQELEADLVVLSTAMEPSQGTLDMERLVPLAPGKDGFIAPLHAKISPVDTSTSGVFVCGAAESPKPIQECITDAGAAASRAASFLKGEGLRVDLVTAHIDHGRCIGCGKCEEWCDFDAIESGDEGFHVIDVACHACGRCAANCPANAIDLRLNGEAQLQANAVGILEEDPDSIIAYACEHCGYSAADLAGAAKRRYPTEVKVVRVPCTGRVSTAQMLLPLEKGAKGVMVAACLDGQCHYIDGNADAKQRVKETRRALDLMGIGAERLQFFHISSAEGERFVKAVESIVKATREDGP